MSGRRNPGNERRDRTRRAREERHGGGTNHRTRVCPDCRRHIPYLDPVQDAPARCECGYVFECPECGREFDSEERDEEGRPPAICPTCDAGIEGGYEEGTEESFRWG